jgi:hypothetical protein
MFFTSPELADYAAFQRALADEEATELVTAGRRGLALLSASPDRDLLEKLQSDIELYLEARDHQRQQADNWRQEADYHGQQADHWRREAEYQQGELARLKRLVDPLGVARSALKLKRRLLPRRPPPRG